MEEHEKYAALLREVVEFRNKLWRMKNSKQIGVEILDEVGSSTVEKESNAGVDSDERLKIFGQQLKAAIDELLPKTDHIKDTKNVSTSATFPPYQVPTQGSMIEITQEQVEQVLMAIDELLKTRPPIQAPPVVTSFVSEEVTSLDQSYTNKLIEAEVKKIFLAQKDSVSKGIVTEEVDCEYEEEKEDLVHDNTLGFGSYIMNKFWNAQTASSKFSVFERSNKRKLTDASSSCEDCSFAESSTSPFNITADYAEHKIWSLTSALRSLIQKSEQSEA